MSQVHLLPMSPGRTQRRMVEPRESNPSDVFLWDSEVRASRHNPALAAFAQRLKAKGKKTKVVLIAVVRKLVTLANALITHNRLWSPAAP